MHHNKMAHCICLGITFIALFIVLTLVTVIGRCQVNDDYRQHRTGIFVIGFPCGMRFLALVYLISVHVIAVDSFNTG